MGIIEWLIIYFVIGLAIGNHQEEDLAGWVFGWLPIFCIRAIKLVYKELKS
jgi:hypothetical protein